MIATVSLTALLVGSLLATDQRITIDATPKPFEAPKTCGKSKADPCIGPKSSTDPSDRATLRFEDAEIVLTALNGGKAIDPDRYYIIHILSYEPDEKEPVVKDANHWYLFCKSCKTPWHESGPSPAKLFEGKRIFGTSEVALAYIHLGVRSANESEMQSALADPVDTAGTLSRATAISRMRDNIALGGTISIKANNGNRLKWLPASPAGMFVEEIYLPVVYKLEVTKKIPSNVQNLRDGILSTQSGSATDIRVTTTPRAFGLIQNTPIEHLPSDIAVTGLVGKGNDQKELGKNLYDNEGRHWWDASFVVPLNNYKQVEYDQTAGQLLPKSVTKQNVFAAFNLYFPRANTKGTIFRWMPHFLYGLPIQGKVLDRHLMGLGMGLNKVEIYAGVTFNRNEVPAASTGPGLNDRWIRKFSLGINIPVKSALDAFKGGKAKE